MSGKKRTRSYSVYCRLECRLVLGKSCCTVGCTRRYSKGCGLQFQRFPQDPERRSKWIAAMKRKDWAPTEYSWICSSHFVGSSSCTPEEGFGRKCLVEETGQQKFCEFSTVRAVLIIYWLDGPGKGRRARPNPSGSGLHGR